MQIKPEEDFMSEMKGEEPKSDAGLQAYLTDEERKKLVASLHHALVWVGVKEPQELSVDKSDLGREIERFHQTESDLPPEVHLRQGTIELHRLIWRLINEKEISDRERIQIEEIIDVLQKKERLEEDALKDEALSIEKARELHDEAAGVIRSILDLKDLLKKRHAALPDDATEELIRQRVNEAKRWNRLVEETKGDKS
jgi:hypothetical protein